MRVRRVSRIWTPLALVALAAGCGQEAPELPREPYLVRDIEPGLLGSVPSALTEHAGALYFAAEEREHGRELWRTDGTDKGTVMVRDIAAGRDSSAPQELFSFRRALLFSAVKGSLGRELWGSDGSEAGTLLVADLYPGSFFVRGEEFGNSSSPRLLARLPFGVLLRAFSRDTRHALWRSDGSSNGTLPLRSLAPRAVVELDGVFYFAPEDPLAGSLLPELWRTDGTASGTWLVRNFPREAPLRFASVTGLAAAGGRLYFSADDGLHGIEPWTSDGTTAGTRLLLDIHAALDVPSSRPLGSAARAFTELGARVVFAAGESLHGTEPWVTDGTTGGTRLIKDINAGAAGSVVGSFVRLGDALVFAAGDGRSGIELWRTDGTAAGTTLVRDIRPGPQSSAPHSLMAAGGRVWFAADDGEHGYELWSSDGTEAGTALVRDVNPGPVGSLNLFPEGPALAFRTHLFVALNDGLHGRELWAVPLPR